MLLQHTDRNGRSTLGARQQQAGAGLTLHLRGWMEIDARQEMEWTAAAGWWCTCVTPWPRGARPAATASLIPPCSYHSWHWPLPMAFIEEKIATVPSFNGGFLTCENTTCIFVYQILPPFIKITHIIFGIKIKKLNYLGCYKIKKWM